MINPPATAGGTDISSQKHCVWSKRGIVFRRSLSQTSEFTNGLILRSSFMSTFTRPLARRQFVAVVTMFLVTTLLVPAPVVAAYAGNRERKGVRPAPAPTKAEREAKVARLELNVASEIELKSRQLLQLSAIPLDTDGNAIQGLSAQWESSAKDVVFVRKNGEAVAGKTGGATFFAC